MTFIFDSLFIIIRLWFFFLAIHFFFSWSLRCYQSICYESCYCSNHFSFDDSDRTSAVLTVAVLLNIESEILESFVFEWFSCRLFFYFFSLLFFSFHLLCFISSHCKLKKLLTSFQLCHNLFSFSSHLQFCFSSLKTRESLTEFRFQYWILQNRQDLI